MTMTGEAVLENVRRYRTVASLYRQTAAFRPHQRDSLLAQAADWESRAVAELEAYFVARQAPQPPANLNYHAPSYMPAPWQVAAA
ncbi:hypothetical protein [Bradyrhizobium sp. STM 3809]|uniref:hypothetical protein n=1 Tax=Bradyrhizobium sp. STM 3809 TaxID=551936 RepID=UPI0002409859|nr:hypothetical protein [Bradyrhizobium sp. STM 3809]CCE01654.1 conserved hypothetical protein [Bradyrhizobium sp. STM 3809]